MKLQDISAHMINNITATQELRSTAAIDTQVPLKQC